MSQSSKRFIASFFIVKTNFKLAVSDIDGTLAEIGHPISQENLHAIQQLQDNGLEFVLASGRHHENMEPYCKEVPGVNWIISAQGGMVANRDRSEILYCGFMERSLVEDMVTAGKKAGYTVLIYTQDGVCSADNDAWVEYYEKTAQNIVTRESYDRLLERKAFKVVWVGETEVIRNAEQVSPKSNEVIQFQTHPHLYEFMPASTSKGKAVAMLAKHLGIELEQVLTMGDGDNDISMLKISGCSIAMGHGSQTAIEAGKLVTPSNIPHRALAHGVDTFFKENIRN